MRLFRTIFLFFIITFIIYLLYNVLPYVTIILISRLMVDIDNKQTI